MLAGTWDNLFLSKDTARSWSTVVLPGRENESRTSVRFVEVIGTAMIAGPHIGGGYISFDKGETWQGIAEIPTDSKVESALEIGEDFYIGRNVGIYKSTDRGSSWFLLSDEWTGLNTSDLAFHSNQIFAATRGGIYHSRDFGLICL